MPPSIPLEGKSSTHPERRQEKNISLVESFRERMAEIEKRAGSPLPESLTEEELGGLSIPQRYQHLISLAANGIPKDEVIREGAGLQAVLFAEILKTRARMGFGKIDPEKANDIIHRSEEHALQYCKKRGMQVDYHRDPNDEEADEKVGGANKKPTVFYSTHQGHEVLMFGAVTGEKGIRVLKDSLMDIRVLGHILTASGSIEVRRKELRELLKKNVKKGMMIGAVKTEAKRVAEEAAQRLKNGKSVIIYPEGTRSRSGEPQFNTWFKYITPAIDAATQDIDLNKRLVTWNDMAAFPDPIEEKPYAPMRFFPRAGVSASLVNVDGLGARDIYKRSVSELEFMLNKRILELQRELELY